MGVAFTMPATARSEWLGLCLAVILMLAVRLPFLPAAFEDIDSINFDLGIHQYNPAAHQPHPPGYPLYIALASLPHGWFASHATALAAVSAVFGSLALIPLYLLFRELASPRVAALASLFTIGNPLVWFTSVRPMSDSVGFCFALVAQALMLRGLRGERSWWLAAALLAGLAGGVRIQTLVLTVPFLVLGCAQVRGRLTATLTAFATGMLLWMLPLVAVLGDLRQLIAAVVPVLADVLAFESTAERTSARALAWAVIDTFVTPWASPWFAAAMLAAAAAGMLHLARVRAVALAHALVLFAPYAVYHLLVQDVGTVRYAMPIVPLVALLAAMPLAQPRRAAWLAGPAALFVAAAVAVTVPALHAYHSRPSPAAQAIAVINEQSGPRVATGHYVFDRYLTLLDPEVERLPPPEEREWRALTQFWRGGRQEMVWFLRSPRRMTLMLFGRDTQQVAGRWAWPQEVQPFMKGTRPGDVELVKMAPPRWLTERGFLARFEDRFSGYEDGHHQVQLRGSKRPRVFVASGTLAGGHKQAEMWLRSEHGTVATWTVGREFSIYGKLPLLPRPGYSPVTLAATAPFTVQDLWIERTSQPAVRPGPGFHVVEHEPDGQRFRWIGDRATAITYLPVARTVLTIKGSAPRPQRLPLTLTLAHNGTPLSSLRITKPTFQFEVDVVRPGDELWGELTLSVSRTFVRAELSGTGDRRRLGVRIHELAFSEVVRP